MKEESKVEYHLDSKNEDMRNQMLKLMEAPVEVQRYYYFLEKVPKHYNAELVVEKEDRISIVRRSYSLMFGNNGCFIKSSRAKNGITYHKKGRSSQRLRIWGGDILKHNAVTQDMLKRIVEVVDPEGKDLFDNDVILQQGTQGMYGYILAENIKTMTEAMEYHIRYSLRGAGIQLDQADNLYKFYDRIRNPYTAKSILRVALNPNRFLEQFQDAEKMGPLCSVLNDSSQRLVLQAMSTGEKVDWADPSFDAKEEGERLQRKGEWVEDILNLWNGGPVLKDPRGPVSPTTGLPLTHRMGGVVIQDPSKIVTLQLGDDLKF